MTRALLCLALCLLFGLVYRQTSAPPVEQKAPAAVDTLPEGDPVAFLQKCIERSEREVQGYSLTLRKQERIAGKLYPVENVAVHFKEKPHSVYMKWLDGPRKGQTALYVEGENDDRILVKPGGLLALAGVLKIKLDSEEARQSGRYSIKEFGMKKATQRVLVNWRQAQARYQLHVEYEGIYPVPQADNRLCYKLHRTRFDQPDSEGVIDFTLYIDKETGLQVGSVLKGEDNRLIGEYYFRDIKFNPTFAANQFQSEILKR